MYDAGTALVFGQEVSLERKLPLRYTKRDARSIRRSMDMDESLPLLLQLVRDQGDAWRITLRCDISLAARSGSAASKPPQPNGDRLSREAVASLLALPLARCAFDAIVGSGSLRSRYGHTGGSVPG